ncbi:polysaccharide pyruvyl transferase family protein [Clostridium arbusti]|uniref:polysaccharide pyruvyl transferase family protein n=1 Tax=Clostridium arbusti TaxID=1137848 RepID=UPI0002896C6F|nr:polysaccharide pyruvyl transferase family protein [Clostridium arbusti]
MKKNSDFNEKTKIGIMTFHASHNCGSILQALALQKILNDLGYNNEIIDFANDGSRKIYSVFVKVNKFKNLLRNILSLIFYAPLKQHYNDYNRYIKKYLRSTSSSYKNRDELKGLDKKYEILISGSDQVWNTKCADADEAYFLSFAHNVKKIAYAVSMASKNIIGQGKDIEDKYRRYILDYKAISVREYNAKKWIEELTHRKVEITLDPTLLLSKVEWESFCADKLCNEKYIFYYSMGYYKDINDIVTRISKMCNMPVYVIDARGWARRALYLRGFKLTKHGGPDVFLSMMKNAELVITTSFHGTIFSTMFEKKFWYINNRTKNTNDDRATFILSQLGLENRFIDGNDINENNVWEPIDYNISKQKVQDLKEYSISFLNDAILK